MAGRRSVVKVLRWREILRRLANIGVSVRVYSAYEGVSEPSIDSCRKKSRDRSCP